MSDTYRRYRAMKRAIMQFYRPRLSGQREQHLNTLVALICGLAGGNHAHLSTIADHAPSAGAKQESVIDRFRRWLKHDRQTIDGWFLPIAKELLITLASQPIQLVMDGPAGDGWECGWARLHCLDGECGLSLSRLATLLGGRSRRQRSFP